MSSQAVIVGATGLVGQEFLRLLLARYDSVTALLRRSTGRLHPRLTERILDFERLGTIEMPVGAHVYCALGTTMKKARSEEAFRKVDYHYPLLLARRAAETGGARFVLVSSAGAGSHSNNFYLRVKGELEEALQALPFDALHVFHPSFLIGDRAEKRSGEAIGMVLASALGVVLVGPLRKYRAIPAVAVAAAMVTAA